VIVSKLFRIAVVLCLAIVSIALLAVLLTELFSLLPAAQTSGIAAVSGGVSEKAFRLVYLLAVLCCLLWLRLRRRSP
jgi:hypothetical protein